MAGTSTSRTGTTAGTHTPTPNRTPQTLATSGVGTPNAHLPPPERHSQPISDDFHMKTKHRDLNSMYNEWFGLGVYDDGKGGVHGRDQIDGAKWREHVNLTHYYRTKRVIFAIQKMAKDEGISDQRAMEQLQPLWEESNTGLCKMTKSLMKRGLLKEGTSRKRKVSQISEQRNDA